MNQDWAAVGQHLRTRRKEKDLSQREVAELVGLDGIDATMVSRWEAGGKVSEPEYLFALEVVLGFDPGEVSRLAGYLPVTAEKRVTPEVALREDPTLDADAVHEVLVFLRRMRRIVARERRSG